MAETIDANAQADIDVAKALRAIFTFGEAATLCHLKGATAAGWSCPACFSVHTLKEAECNRRATCCVCQLEFDAVSLMMRVHGESFLRSVAKLQSALAGKAETGAEAEIEAIAADMVAAQYSGEFVAVKAEHAKAARGLQVGGEDVAEVMFSLPHWDDEVVPHHGTLLSIANFLAKGAPDAPAGHTWHGEQSPRADYVDLEAMWLFADRRLVWVEGRTWRIEPPLPVPCDFMAVRSGPGFGWDIEGIFAPPDGCDVYTEDAGGELSDAFAFGFDPEAPDAAAVIDDVVFAINAVGGSITWNWPSGRITPMVAKMPAPKAAPAVAGSTL